MNWLIMIMGFPCLIFAVMVAFLVQWNLHYLSWELFWVANGVIIMFVITGLVLIIYGSFVEPVKQNSIKMDQ